jgi:hypothetical protein
MPTGTQEFALGTAALPEGVALGEVWSLLDLLQAGRSAAIPRARRAWGALMGGGA